MREHSGLVFSVDEYRRRLERVREGMDSRGLAWLMVGSPDNLFYLTGHQTSGYDQIQALFVPLQGSPFGFCRRAEWENFTERTWLEPSRVFVFEDIEDPILVLKAVLEKEAMTGKIVGREENTLFLSRRTHQRFDEELSVRFADASGVVESVRLVKSAEEISLIRKAGLVTEKAMEAAIEACRPDVTENHVAAQCHQAMYEAGGEYPSVPPYITSGPRTNICHATWEGRTLESGDLIYLELAGCLKRYHAAMMRAVFLGTAPQVLLDAEQMVSEDIEMLMSAMKPGATAHEIDTLAHHGRYEALGATRFSRAGYSIGIAFAPSWDEGQILSLNRGDHTPLEENMVFHLIPWLQLPKEKLAMPLSETVVVGPNGANSLFSHPRKLVVKQL